MKPTMKLRIALREVQVPATRSGEVLIGGKTVSTHKEVWQQWWENPPPRPLGMPGPIGEWRDVPVEVEE